MHRYMNVLLKGNTVGRSGVRQGWLEPRALALILAQFFTPGLILTLTFMYAIYGHLLLQRMKWSSLIGLEKAAVTIWSTTNLLSTSLSWPVLCFLHPALKTWDGGTGAVCLYLCHPAAPASTHPAEIPVTTSSQLEIFSTWPQAPGPLREGISWWFLHCSLWKSYTTRATRKCLHCLAFFLISANNDSKIILISIPKKHIVDSLLVGHRISLPWELQKTALLSATSFKGVPGVLNEKFI